MCVPDTSTVFNNISTVFVRVTSSAANKAVRFSFSPSVALFTAVYCTFFCVDALKGDNIK